MGEEVARMVAREEKRMRAIPPSVQSLFAEPPPPNWVRSGWGKVCVCVFESVCAFK